MTLVLLALVAGVVVGFARGGGLVRLAALKPRQNRLVLTAIALHAVGVLGGWLWQPLLPMLVGLSWAVLGYYAWVNRQINGASLVAAGLLANAFVILLNGATPVSTDAAVRAGTDTVAAVEAGNHEPIGPDTKFAWLGKVVPVAFPPRPEVVSPGDIAIAAGLAVVMAMGLTGRREPAAWLSRELDRTDEPAHDDEVDDPTDEHETIDAEAEPQRSAAL